MRQGHETLGVSPWLHALGYTLKGFPKGVSPLAGEGLGGAALPSQKLNWPEL
ncbi:MAG: hypothetical protein K0S07_823 [Chlamydiales bacterium]|jgi:hypothetical protein|nr:hypothetical protein [Chlamydiales bacterium]